MSFNKKHSLRMTLAALAALSMFACDDSQNTIPDDPSSSDEKNIEVYQNDLLKGAFDINAVTLDQARDVVINGESVHVLPVSNLVQSVLNLSDEELDRTLAGHTCDFEGADGFRPSFKSNCAGIVFSCEKIKLSYVDLETGTLVHDDAMVFDENSPSTRPGCFTVKNLTKVLMTEVREGATMLKLYVDGAFMGEVDLQTLSQIIVERNGQKMVKIADLLARMQPNIQIADYTCDFLDKDGKLLSDDASCPVRSCADAAEGYIALDTLDIDDDNAASKAACYEMSSVREIHMTTPETDTPFEIEIEIDGISKGSIDVKTLSDKFFDEAGTKMIYAADVIKAVAPNVNLSAFLCDYNGLNDDGSTYSPTDKSKCQELRSCSYASTATINLTTEKMTMTDADMQSCHNVGNIFKIILTTNPNADPAPEPYAIKVVIDGKDTSVNAWDLSDKIQDNDGEKTIPLIEIVKAALGDDADVSQYTCDYANADESFVSSSKSACAEIQSCTFADMLTLSLTNEKLFSEDSSVPSCYSVKGFGTIYVTSVKD